MIMEAKKSYNMPSANWRAKKSSGGITQSEAKGLKTRGANGVNLRLRPKALELGSCWYKFQGPKA